MIYAPSHIKKYVKPNRKKHIPYIFKALIIANPEKIGDMLQCQDGKN